MDLTTAKAQATATAHAYAQTQPTGDSHAILAAYTHQLAAAQALRAAQDASLTPAQAADRDWDTQGAGYYSPTHL